MPHCTENDRTYNKVLSTVIHLHNTKPEMTIQFDSVIKF